jgi:serine O-acetyltransferase
MNYEARVARSVKGARSNTDAHRLFGLIASDIRAKAQWVYGSTSRRNILKALLTEGSAAMVVYRLMQTSQRWGLTPLAMLFNKTNVLFGSCIIGRRAEFGPGFVLNHAFGVVINGAVKGGKNIRLEHLVTIGTERNLAPTLGDNIYIGAGAKIIGGITIGSNVKIGANAVVVKDLPDGVTAVGVPAKIVRTQPNSDADTRC